MSVEQFQLFECAVEDKCKAMVQLVQPEKIEGEFELTCCGKAMKPLDAKTQDEGKEKHVPVVETGNGEVKVIVGSTKHPMEPDHWIQFIEVCTKDGVHVRKYLSPGDEPEATFTLDGEVCCVREHCNKHGLWKR